MKYTLLFSAILLSIITNAQNLEWAKSIGGKNSIYANRLFIDSDKNTVIVGQHRDSCDMDPSEDEYFLTTTNKANGISHTYLAKYSTDGDFIFAKSIGVGNKGAYIRAAGIDKDDNVIIAGNFSDSADFDPGDGEFYLDSKGVPSSFLAKYDTEGELVFAKKIDGSTYTTSITMDEDGNIYSYGTFRGEIDFDSSADSAKLTPDGLDVYISKYDKNGNFIWVKSFTGASDQYSGDLKVNSSGNLILTGYFNAEIILDPEPYIIKAVGFFDGFFAEMDSNGQLNWAKALTSLGQLKGTRVDIGTNDTLYISAYFNVDVDVDPDLPEVIIESAGNADGFYGKYTPSGELVSYHHLSGSEAIVIGQIVVNNDNEVFLMGGHYGEVSFNTDPNSFKLTHNADQDVFFAYYDRNGKLKCAQTIGNEARDNMVGMSFIDDDNFVYVGEFFSSLDVDPSNEETILTSKGNIDLSIVKYSVCAHGIGNSIPTIATINSANAYPNPTTGLVQFEGDNIENAIIAITDVYGRSIDFKKITSSSIDISEVSSGIYFCSLQIGNVVQSIRIVKQ